MSDLRSDPPAVVFWLGSALVLAGVIGGAIASSAGSADWLFPAAMFVLAGAAMIGAYFAQ